MSASFISGDSYEGVRCSPGWSAERLFGSARRGHMARLANALLWFDVDARAGWVAPLVRVADRPHDVISSPVRSPVILIQRLDQDMELQSLQVCVRVIILFVYQCPMGCVNNEL